MATKLIIPSTDQVPDTSGNCGPFPYTDSGANIGPEVCGYKASLAADSYWNFIFPIPNPLPSGVSATTGKIMLSLFANATANTAKLTPKTAIIYPGGSITQAILYAEAQQTVTWAATANQNALTFTLGVGGTGYAAGDIFQVSGGTASVATLGYVVSVAAGVVTGVAILQQGVYSTIPTGTLATTVVTGSGNGGLTVTATWTTAGDAGRWKTVTSGVIQAARGIVTADAGQTLLCQVLGSTSGWTLAAALGLKTFLMFD